MTCPCTATIETSPDGIVRGDTGNWSVSFCSSTEEPIDVTGWELYLIIRDTKDPDDATTCFKIKTTVPPSDLATGGCATISIPSSSSALFPAGKYYFEYKRVLPDTSPKDVWTFLCSDRPTFVVKDGTVLDPLI